MSENIITLPALSDVTNGSDVKFIVDLIRKDVNGLGKWASYAERYGVTPATIKDHAAALASLAYPDDEPVQAKDGVRTRYGVAVNTAKTGLKRALGVKGESKTSDALLTSKGAKATLEDVIAAWHAAQQD